MLNLVKTSFLWPSCQTDIVFYKTHTIINAVLCSAISYAVVHNIHAKSKKLNRIKHSKVYNTTTWLFKTIKYYNLKIR